MEKVYKRSIWKCWSNFLFFIFLGTIMMIPFLLDGENKETSKIFLGGLMCFVVGILIFEILKSLTITVDDEFITITDLDIKLGKWRLGKPQFTQIKWEDIIAIYMVRAKPRITREKIVFVIPKANTGDPNVDEAINLEVKTNKNSKRTKVYIDWLIVNHKKIEIPKGIKEYYGLLKEIYNRTPNAVIDDEIRRLIKE